jgi:chromosome segregation ATPase
MRTQIDTKMAALRGELQKADAELATLRPRVQYLEALMLRLDGALTALQNLLEEATPVLGNGTTGERGVHAESFDR